MTCSMFKAGFSKESILLHIIGWRYYAADWRPY